MQAEVARIARDHGLALLGPNCMGVIDLDVEQRRRTSVTSRRTCRAAASPGSPSRVRSPTRSSTPAIGSGSRASSAAAPRSSSTCATTSPTASTTPRRSSVILFVEGFKRPERFLALADRALELGKPIMAVKVGRSDQAQAAAIAHSGSLAGEVAGHGRRARCGRGHPLPRPRRAARDRRAGRGRAPDGSAGRPRPDRGRHRLDRRGLAHRRPRAAGPGLDLPPIPPSARAAILAALPTMGYIGNPLDPWGAADPAHGLRRRCSRRWPRRARTTCSRSSTTSRTARCRRRSPPRTRSPPLLLNATAGRPAILPVYVSLTSGEPPPETKALLDSTGRRRAAAARRRRGVPCHRRGRALGGASRGPDRAAARGERRGPRWPRTGRRTAPTRRRPRRGRAPRWRCPSARASPSSVRPGSPSTEPIAVRDAAAAVAAARRIGRPVALKLDAVGLTHKSDVGGVVLGLRGDDAVYAAALDLLETGAPARPDGPRPARRADGASRVSS